MCALSRLDTSLWALGGTCMASKVLWEGRGVRVWTSLSTRGRLLDVQSADGGEALGLSSGMKEDGAGKIEGPSSLVIVSCFFPSFSSLSLSLCAARFARRPGSWGARGARRKKWPIGVPLPVDASPLGRGLVCVRIASG